VIEATPDPAVVVNTDLRERIVAAGLPWRVRDNGTNIEMVLIPPGSFNMGCSASELYGCSGNENPNHTVIIAEPFYMSRTEVPQAHWQATMGTNPSYFRESNGFPNSANRPVEQVSWNTIQGFLTSTGLRLPTEAEWEYAYRAGTTTAFHGFTGYPNGTDDDTLVGNIGWHYPSSNLQTWPVGGRAANGFGLFDMPGNVWEWVSDWYGSDYYASSPTTNPSGPATGTARVLRGGSWSDYTYDARSSDRDNFTPDYANSNVGFRVARNP
jgi:formylglycine-generating enzyme required for sulfatase activity